MRSTSSSACLALDAIAHAGPCCVARARRASPACADDPRVPRLLPGRHRRDVRPQPGAGGTARSPAGPRCGSPRDAAVHAHGRVGQRLAHSLSPAALVITLSASDANRFVLRWARAITAGQGAGVRRLLPRHGGRPPWSTWTRSSAPSRAPACSASARSRARHGGRSFQRHRRGGARAGTRATSPTCLTEPALTNCGLVPRCRVFSRNRSAPPAAGLALGARRTTHRSATAGRACASGMNADFTKVIGLRRSPAGCPARHSGWRTSTRMEAAKRAAPGRPLGHRHRRQPTSARSQRCANLGR